MDELTVNKYTQIPGGMSSVSERLIVRVAPDGQPDFLYCHTWGTPRLEPNFTGVKGPGHGRRVFVNHQYNKTSFDYMSQIVHRYKRNNIFSKHAVMFQEAASFDLGKAKLPQQTCWPIALLSSAAFPQVAGPEATSADGFPKAQ